MKPGTYTMNLYQDELLVNTQKVTVTAGKTATSNIAAAFHTFNQIWQIGIWDGKPNEFLNAGENGQLRMHPSDNRIVKNWKTAAYAVGSPAC